MRDSPSFDCRQRSLSNTITIWGKDRPSCTRRSVSRYCKSQKGTISSCLTVRNALVRVALVYGRMYHRMTQSFLDYVRCMPYSPGLVDAMPYLSNAVQEYLPLNFHTILGIIPNSTLNAIHIRCSKGPLVHDSPLPLGRSFRISQPNSSSGFSASMPNALR